MKKRLYVADDECKILELLRAHLSAEGYEVETFADGQKLLARYDEKPCDMVITDIMMPGLSGYDLCREIRRTSDVPIFMISARDDEIDRVLGLELGSDDYISKPFSLRELSVRIKNIFSRIDRVNIVHDDGELVCRDVRLNKADRTAFVGDMLMKTTAREFDLLTLFFENKNMAFSRERIISAIWGYDYYGDTRQVDHLIKRLRKKMLLAGAECQIETVWGYGYKVSDYEGGRHEA